MEATTPLEIAPQVLADLLNLQRDKFNARIALAQSRQRGLSSREWKGVLQECVAPLVFAVHQALPERAQAVAEAAYESALKLLARNQLGPRAGGPMLVLWRDVLPLLAPLVAQAPRRALSRASNALLELQAHHLEEVWIKRLHSLAQSGAFASCEVESFERALLVLAWRCGLAHGRQSALKYLSALPFELTRALVGAPDVPEAAWAELVQKMERELFFNPSRAPEAQEKRLKLVAQVGDWEAWGGAMAAPPLVLRRKGALWAWSGRAWWRLHADAFGATLTPARFFIAPEQLPLNLQTDQSCGAWKLQVKKIAAASGSNQALQVTQGANAVYQDAQAALLPGFDGVLSAASDEHLLAFTSRLSMRVFVVARAS